MDRIKYIGKIEYDTLMTGTKIVICGFGIVGRRVYEYLIKNGIEKTRIIICDRNYIGLASKLNDITIESYETVFSLYKEGAAFLVTNLDIKKTVEYLIKKEVRNIHVVF